MKYFHLIWAALFRRKTRTIFTLLSVLAAFLLFGMLDAVRAAFNAPPSAAGVSRLVVSSPISIIRLAFCSRRINRKRCGLVE